MVSGKLLHYLDDSLGCDRDKNSCKDLMELFKNVLLSLNVPIADEKTEGPVTVLTFLGFELDSNKMVVRIPKEKIQEILFKIDDFVEKENKVTYNAKSNRVVKFCLSSNSTWPSVLS